jgi:hypothetical protein
VDDAASRDRHDDVRRRDVVRGTLERVPVEHDQVRAHPRLDRAGVVVVVDERRAARERGDRGREVDPLRRNQRGAFGIAQRPPRDGDLDLRERVRC